MATSSSIENSGAGSQPVGTVVLVRGTVQAVAADNSVRLLEAGSPVFLGERIVTGNDGMISIALGGGVNGQLDLGRMSDVLINNDLFPAAPGDFTEAVAEVEQVQEALLAGDFDPTTDFEPTAAGPAAAGPADDGGGSSYVEFTLTGEAVTPTSGAETTGIGLNFLDPEPQQFEEPETPVVLAAIIPPPPAAPAPAAAPAAEEPPPEDPPPEDPVDFTPSVGVLRRVLDEENLDDGTNPDDTQQDETFDPDQLVTSGTLVDLGVDFGGDGPGSLTFTNFDSTDTEIIAIDGNAASTVTVTGQYGVLVIDGTGAWTYTLNDNVSHPNAGLTGLDDIVSDPFSIVVIDGNGTPAGPGSLTIDILDDGPVAREAEISRVLEEEALNNYSPGASPIEGSKGNPDNFDGPEDDTQPDARVVNGSLSSLVDMGADNPGTFSITIPADLPTLFSKGGTITYEMNVNGTTLEAWVRQDVPSGDDVFDTAQFQDGPRPEQGGDRLIFSLDVQSNGNYTFTLYDQLDHVDGDGENTALLVKDGEPITELALGAAIIATDSDKDSIGFVDQALTFTIVDDVPTLVKVGHAFFYVSEDALGNDDPPVNPWNNDDVDDSKGNLDGLLSNLFATDRAYFNLSSLVKVGADEKLTWSLKQPEGEPPPEEEQGDFEVAASGDYASTLTSKGETVYYRVDGNTLTGYTGPEEAMNVIFSFSVDSTTGWATFDLNDQLDHDAGDFLPDLNIILIKDLGQFVVATDFDGDSVDLGEKIIVKVENDVPEGGKQLKIYVQEDALGNTGDVDDESLGNLEPPTGDVEQVSGNLSSVVKPGADEDVTFKLKELSNVDSGLKSNGEKVYYNSDGATLTAATAAGATIFLFSVDANGDYTFDLEDQLDHTGRTKDDSTNLSFDLGKYIEATDADNDTISLNGLVKIFVENDVPIALLQPQGIVAEVLEDGMSRPEDGSEGIRESGETFDDDEAEGSSNALDSSNLNSLFKSGADEKLTFGITTNKEVLDQLSELSSNGEKLYYTSDGSKLTANAGAGRPVFTLEVNDDGSWKFDLKDQLDHTAGDGENWALRSGDGSVPGIDFSKVITAIDADGDTVTGAAEDSFVIKVQDDVPEVIETSQYFFISEYAGFNNTIGIYELDDLGKPTNPRIIVAESNDLANFSQASPTYFGGAYTEGVPLGFYEAGTKMFLIANGGGAVGESSNLAFRAKADTDPVDAPAFILQVESSPGVWADVNEAQGIYFMDSYLDTNPPGSFNGGTAPDGISHFTDQWSQSPWPAHFINDVPVNGGEVRIEDLNFGDGDFDDTVLRVEKGPVVSESNLADGSGQDPNTNLMVSGNFFTPTAAGIQFKVGADEDLTLSIESIGIPSQSGAGTAGDSGEVDIKNDGTSMVFSGSSAVFLSEAGKLEVWSNGDWQYTLLDNTLKNPDNDKGAGDKHDGDYDRFAADQVQDIFKVVATDADGDSVETKFIVNINDDGPSANEDTNGIHARVEEDDMNLVGGDFSQGYNEDGSSNLDEASGSSGSLAPLFIVGADNENVTYGLTNDFSSLGNLQSKGSSLNYEVVNTSGGEKLVATNSDTGGEVFTLEVKTDGSWNFDLKDQLDHELDGNTEGYVLKGSTASGGQGIDFSSVVMVTDADGDTALGAVDNSFVIKVQDDVPVAKEVEAVPANLNLVLILDKSGSMGDNKIKFDGTDGITRMAALQAAVVGLLGQLDTSAAENVRVHIVAYDTDAEAIGTFDIRQNGAGGIELVAATTAVNGIPSGGFTNYEAGYQQALDWINNGNPLTSGDVGGDPVVNQVIFVSDGVPNRWNHPDYDGTNHYPQGSGGNFNQTALDQLAIEITALDAWADSVRAIGINVSATQDDRLDGLDSTGDALNIDDAGDLISVLPQLLYTTTPLIGVKVLEDGLNDEVLADGDNATGNKESGESDSDDEASGSGAQNLSALFEVGADEELTFSMVHSLGSLPQLYSGGQQVAYSFSGNTLTAHVGGDTVFSFTINNDGTWSFDLDGALDHVAGDGENLELLSGAGKDQALNGIDLSSLIVATDADGDTVAASKGAFVISVEDDKPEVEAPAYDAILANETGNNLVADLNIEAGADGFRSVVINPLDKDGNPVGSGDKVYVNGDKLIVNGQDVKWYVDGQGQWSAKAGSQVLFTVAPEVVAGAFTGNYTVEQVNEFNTEKEFFYDFQLKPGKPVEEATVKVFTPGGGVQIVVTADSPNVDPDLVNVSQQGIGVDNNLINEVGGVGETLKFAFTGIDDKPLNMTWVKLEFDHLDDPPHQGQANAEWATWKAYAYDDNDVRQEVGSGQFPGIWNGTSTDVTYKIEINSGNTTFQELEVSITSPDTAEGFRIETIKGEYEQNTEYVFDFQAEVTDGDGDKATTEFSVTFENDAVLDGGDGAEVIAGSSLADDIVGGGGDDIIMGGGGNDTIDGGAGNDVIFGGTGNDTIDGGTGDDTLVGGTGADILDGEEDDDTIFPDTVDGSNANVDDGAVDIVTGGPGVDSLVDPPAPTTENVTGGIEVDLDTLIPPPEEPVV